MKHKPRFRLAFCAIVACLCSASWSQAQDDSKKNPTYRVKDGDRFSSVGIITPQENDSRIARWLLIEEQAIIECSKMAQEKASSDSVKQFAQMMVTDHHSCVDKLDRIRKASSTMSDSGKPGSPPIAKSENADVDLKKSGIVVRDADGKQRDGKMIYHPTDFVQVKETVCKEMKSAMAKEMNMVTGSEFDRAYVMHMVAGHEAMLASCKAVRSTATKELQALLDESIDQLNAHLKHARQLCGQVTGKTVR